jgi:protein N-terminal amidase
VTVGYPETAAPPGSDSDGPYYNSTVTVSPSGEILANVRKHFLYYTDETWANEGVNTSLAPPPSNPSAEPTPGPAARALPSDDSAANVVSPPGFFSHDFGTPGLGSVSMGICMDINNYRFLAPFNAYEFANHVLESNTSLTVLSMAWLTHLLPQQLTETSSTPDESTVAYWVERFHPLKGAADREEREYTVVIANRCGTEDGERGAVCYAGSSTVIRFVPGERVEIFDVCGKATEELMVVDLGKHARPKFALQRGS